MIEAATEGIEGVRVYPDRLTGWAALVVAGSSGRIDADRARLLAHHGVVAESIRWFGGATQHSGVWEIPLETFSDRVDALAGVADKIMIVGTSFGAEAALLTGNRCDRVDAVVAFAPSDVVWAGRGPGGEMTSHWTIDGEPVPFVPLIDSWRTEASPPSYRLLYEQSRAAFSAQLASAQIAVDRIKHLILVAGGDDQVWPSVLHADAIRDKRTTHGKDTIVVTDSLAGHRTLLPGEPLITAGVEMRRGGDEAADRRLGRQAWEQIEGLLRRP